MPRKVPEMSALEVRRLIHPGQGRNATFAVGGVSGLYLQCTPNDAKSWIVRCMVGARRRDLHVNYESVDPYKVEYEGGALLLDTLTDDDFRVEKMKFGRGKDKTTVIYNGKITMKGIPLDAYEYVVNGKPALEWVMERQAVKTDKASGIVNDANLYATETVGDARYPLMLFRRVIPVSLETIKIVRALPRLDFNTLN